jgi:transcriptional regulator GlxA family with amidase domain
LPARRDPGRGEPPIDALFVLTPRSLLLDLAGPAEALRLANAHLQQAGRAPRFRLRYVAPAARLESSVGVELANLEPLPAALVAPTWLTLIGQPSAVLARPDPATLATARWLEQHMTACLAASAEHRLVTICSGTLLAARAGLLGTRRCTTHHTLLDRLRRLAPRADVVDNRVFVLDGALASSAGVTAGIDLVLHLIASTCGESLAATIAQDMVVYLRRTPADPELSPMLAHRHHLHPVVHRVQDAVSARPTADWDADAMASTAHVSARHLGRLFARHAGVSPLHYLESLRLELARQALRGGASVTRAAEAAGFHSDLQLRRAWRRHHGGTPRDATRPPVLRR